MLRSARYALVPPLAAACLAGLLAGCGFVGASGVSHTKPNTFVLRGRVSVPAAGSEPVVAGASCVSALPDVNVGAAVTVADPDGHQLGRGTLGGGVAVAVPGKSGASCDFPFQIRGVPGEVSRYAISVAGRPAQTFEATALREDQQAVITLTS